jgi:Raf kinase inhibitor-like YbhB/YbcL family protein
MRNGVVERVDGAINLSAVRVGLLGADVSCIRTSRSTHFALTAMPADHRAVLACSASLLLAALAGVAPATAQRAEAPVAYQDVRSVQIPHAGFTLVSADLRGGRFTRRQESSAFGCSGENLSPALSWSGAPPGTRSFAVTIFDPDAPTGSGFWHWIVYNIPATVSSLPAGAGHVTAASLLPAGAAQATTDFGTPGYGGACPPSGAPEHRYVITVHALKTEHASVPQGATPAVVRFVLHTQTIATASLVARYARPAAGGVH